LKDKGKLEQPEAITFETGSNRWTSFEAWPPRSNVTQRNLYFHANGQLSFDSPKGAQAQLIVTFQIRRIPCLTGSGPSSRLTIRRIRVLALVHLAG